MLVTLYLRLQARTYAQSTIIFFWPDKLIYMSFQIMIVSVFKSILRS